ncbi:hypothetical protein SY83_13335 [Paenibacillus swuensis]|uniref:Sulfatase N-terminal domain-containing protein n=2 Tax=Paenibacillus swuensis TaxID=1178515 RepID=A0A172TPK4_9BACL|nr:hypothetical protein SY83_13335 [Paenibacillus swuensis]
MRTAHTNPYTPELPTPYEAILPPYVKTFTEYLRRAGYYCSNNAKTDYQFAPPLTAWDDCSHSAHWRNRDKDQPFFAVFNPIITHESGMWKDENPLNTDPDRIAMPPYLPDTPKSRQALARHYDNLMVADQAVGRLLEELEEDGLTEQTIVFLWSDHGEGLPRAKRWLYDAGIRVPMIVSWPGQIPAGQSTDRLVSLVDLAPTVLSMAGLEIPAHMQGVPFLETDLADREYVFAARDRFDESYDMVRAVRDRRYKYIRNYYPELPYLLWIPYSHQHPVLQELQRLEDTGALTPPMKLLLQPCRPTEELYDCEADPHEINNLAGEQAHAVQLSRLREAMDGWRSRYGDLGDMDEELMVRLRCPEGVKPTAVKPILVPINAQHAGIIPITDAHVEYSELTKLLLHTATQGASIAYTMEDGDIPRWKIYNGPIQLERGKTLVRARSVRIGFCDSEEARVVITIT